MTLYRIVPGRWFYLCLLCLGLGFIALSFAGLAQASYAAAVVLAVILGWAAYDAWMMRSPPALKVERYLPRNLALKQWKDVELSLFYSGNFTLIMELYDGIDSSVRSRKLPLKVIMKPGQRLVASYELCPMRRGPLTFADLQIKCRSRFAWWDVIYKLPLSRDARVLPDFSAISRYMLLTMENRSRQLGILRRPQRGEGTEFNQLREYRQGDSLRQINWKASSHYSKLISQEYHQETDQRVIVMVDSGRRMLAMDGGLSHFDHSLNALMLISHIALRQGDAVGVMSFGTSERWIPAQKGSAQTGRILNKLYDIEADAIATDYVAAARSLLVQQRKRSLVILVTNVRDEDSKELHDAVSLLKKRHLVLVANIREQVLDETLQQPVHDFDEALRYCGVQEYVLQRQQGQRALVARGVFSLDCLADKLAVTLANSYLEIKGAGIL